MYTEPFFSLYTLLSLHEMILKKLLENKHFPVKLQFSLKGEGKFKEINLQKKYK